MLPGCRVLTSSNSLLVASSIWLLGKFNSYCLKLNQLVIDFLVTGGVNSFSHRRQSVLPGQVLEKPAQTFYWRHELLHSHSPICMFCGVSWTILMYTCLLFWSFEDIQISCFISFTEWWVCFFWVRISSSLCTLDLSMLGSVTLGPSGSNFWVALSRQSVQLKYLRRALLGLEHVKKIDQIP